MTLAMVLTLTACGEDRDTSAADACGVTVSKVDTSKASPEDVEARGKPDITVPDQPATELCRVDDVVGTGAEVGVTSTVTVHYVGVGQQSGKEFDSSWDRGQPISFGLNGVIRGWSEGLVGMKEGGRRTLVIPADLAYGDNPPGAGIAPGETLIFVVDLIKVD